ncbi:PucR family transcriptional regulator [Streptomyces marispadix]|uniref:Helix-turn-helix domain-containing protein n=1 Tax=Streptomyces marispadix TaxID=2922868 RepID=A0ABS9SX55_9ACTN|nr:helix-turn-helix domain-containing protein [Streptomyces marispadix]MCH6160842.1 helix-turn-helix domain-containing protein [Streptomyces marispadix]
MAAFRPVPHLECGDSPPRARAVRRLQREAPVLARQLLDGPHLPASAGHLAVRDVAEDVALWLSVLAGDITGADVAHRFRRRGRTHSSRHVPLEDAVLLQHICARLIDEAVTAEISRRHDKAGASGTGNPGAHGESGDCPRDDRFGPFGRGDGDDGGRRRDDARGEAAGHDTAARPDFDASQGEFTRILATATTAVAAGYRDARLELPSPVDEIEQTVKTLSGGSGHGAGTADLPGHIATPLRWCLASVRLTDAHPASRRFRAANPHALTAVTDSRLICYSRERPTVPEGFPAHGLACVDDDTALAARHAIASAGLAHHYGLDQVKAQQVLPVIRALEQDPARHEAFIDSCLGPLRTSDRHRHLLDTLRAYLAHGLRTTPAARSLYVHRHTFTYRLHSIRRLTGLDLAHPLHRLRAELALLLLSVQLGAEAGRRLG